MKTIGLFLVMSILSSAFSAVAAENPKVMARTKYGIIRSIDLQSRTAIISGFKYAFGSVEDGRTAEVKLYGSEYGALELLKVGMKVKVVYGEFGFMRVVLRLQQLADNAVIEET